MSHKLSAFRAYFNRLLSIPLSRKNFNEELNTIFHIAQVNGFPHNIIRNLYNKIKFKFLDTSTSQTKSKKSNLNPPIRYISLPYIGPQTSKIQRAFSKYNIVISQSVDTNLKSFFVHQKDPIDSFSRSGVYKLVCNCGHYYIGRSFRKLDIRIHEHTQEIHKNFFQFDLSKIKSNFSKHVLLHGHEMDKVDILHTNSNNYLIDRLEKMHITYSTKKDPDSVINEQVQFENNILDNFLNLKPNFKL